MPPEIRSPRDLYGWLLASARDGGRNSLSEVAQFACNEDEGLAQRPAAASLLIWGESGRAALAQNAISKPSVKNLISALQILSLASVGTTIPNGVLYIHNEELISLINASLVDPYLRSVSRMYLQEVFQNVSTDDLLIPLGTSFSSLGIYGEAASDELIRAMSARWLRIGPSTISAYERLIADHPDNEPAFQKFLSLHPQLLDPMAMQVWDRPDFHGAQQPDFLIRRADNSYLVVEIECPSKLLLTQAAQLSADATHGEKQATDYRSFLNERTAEVRRHFPDYRNAECLVVVGIESTLTQTQLNALANVNGARHNVRIVGFDWLARRAHTIVENMSRAEVEVIKGHRVT